MAYDSESWEDLPICPECKKKILSTENKTLIHFKYYNPHGWETSVYYHSKCSEKFWMPKIDTWFKGFY